MVKPLTLYIASRYTRAKRDNRFISFIASASIIGIALGMTVLITVLSVMNGFNQVIENQVFTTARHVTVGSFTDTIEDWQAVTETALSMPGIEAAAPFIDGQGLLVNYGTTETTAIIGVLPEAESRVSNLTDTFIAGNFSELVPGQFGIILGRSMANYLGVDLGEKITVVTPEASISIAGIVPRFKRFTVVGIFDVQGGFASDRHLAYIHLYDAQILFQLADNVTNVRLKLTRLYDAPLTAYRLFERLPVEYYTVDWTREYGSLFKAIDLEKKMMFLVLTFIIAIAVFNLVSTMVMTVNDKRSEIAIMRTIGATPKLIRRIFIWQGMIIAGFGIIFGIAGGVALSLTITDMVNIIEQYLNIELISSNVYIVNYLPSQLNWSDVSYVTMVAVLLSLLATLYPARRAARTQPAEVLRYE